MHVSTSVSGCLAGLFAFVAACGSTVAPSSGPPSTIGSEDGGSATPPAPPRPPPTVADASAPPRTDASPPADATADASDAADSRPPVGQDAGSTETGNGVEVTWQLGCWHVEAGHRYQAIQFRLVTSSPVPLEATLFFNARCDPSDGTDNLNDTGGTIGSGSYEFWFIHHPDEMPSSAIWSFEGLSSACIDYGKAPDC